MQGFLNLSLPAIGIRIKDVCYHVKNGSKWISMPAKSYEKNGATLWAPVIEFDSRESKDAFQHAAIRAIDQFTEGANPESQEGQLW